MPATEAQRRDAEHNRFVTATCEVAALTTAVASWRSIAYELRVALREAVADHQSTIESECSVGNSEQDWREDPKFEKYYQLLDRVKDL